MQKMSGTRRKVADTTNEAEKKIHSELLALPCHGSQVYIEGISHIVSEGDLRIFCQSMGEVLKVTYEKERCRAFVTFNTKELASKAAEELNNFECNGKRIECSITPDKHKLYIGNVPTHWTEEHMKKVVAELGPGVISVELSKDPENTGCNSRSALIEYHNHACAEYSMQKMSNRDFKLDSNAPTVMWDDESLMGRSVCVKNLPENISPDRLKALFEHHGNITNAVLLDATAGPEKNRFGLVKFAEMSSAMKALKETEKYEIDGHTLECSLVKRQADQQSSGARPPEDQRASGGENSQNQQSSGARPPADQRASGAENSQNQQSSGARPPPPDQRASGEENSQNSVVLPTYPPHPAYGTFGDPYGAAAYAQPPMYGFGVTPAVVRTVPMPLPDRMIAYPFQQPQPGLQQPQPGFQQPQPGFQPPQPGLQQPQPGLQQPQPGLQQPQPGLQQPQPGLQQPQSGLQPPQPGLQQPQPGLQQPQSGLQQPQPGLQPPQPGLQQPQLGLQQLQPGLQPPQPGYGSSSDEMYGNNSNWIYDNYGSSSDGMHSSYGSSSDRRHSEDINRNRGYGRYRPY